jgi:uncharacterized membrane protein
MELSANQILYISVLVCLFLILNIVVTLKNRLQSFSIIALFLSIIILIVLATLSSIKKN